MNSLLQKRTHFPRTTASQRQLLFQLWETTGNAQLACRKARVSTRTFYNWKPKFLSGGYEALEQFASHAPKNPHRVKPEIELKVIKLRQQHPNWGKQRMADELAKSNNWVPLVSPNTVRRILLEAGLWTQVKTESKKKKQTHARTADKPGQTVNVDLCFVPATHEVASKLPAVSGSSGRLVVERTLDKAAKSEPQWPGRIFEDQNLTYEEAMTGFVEAQEAKSELPKDFESPEAAAAAALVAEKRAIRQEEEALRAQRRLVRTQRKMEDQAWIAIRELKAAQKAAEKAAKKADQAQKAAEKATQKTQKTSLSVETTMTSTCIVDLPDEAKNSSIYGTQPPVETNLLLNYTPPTGKGHLVARATILKASNETHHLPSQATIPSENSETYHLPPQATTPSGGCETGNLLPKAATTSDIEPNHLGPKATTSDIEPNHLGPKATISDIEPNHLGPKATTSDIEPNHLGPKTITPDIETNHLLPKTTTSEVETVPKATTSTLETNHLLPKATTDDYEASHVSPEAITCDVETSHLSVETQVERAKNQPISDSEWRQLRAKRRAQKEQRKQENIKWREKRQSIRERLSALPLVTAWIAILVIVDNCTRQCIGLPLFMVGPHVTAEMIVEALQTLLPPELQFLLSDRGTHFRAKIFEMFAQSVGFQHVFTARHRPQSNGIAERFVRTLKEWLADKSWNSEEELLALLAEFQEEYNERPHQGIAIPGLSPNEYARRIWLR